MGNRKENSSGYFKIQKQRNEVNRKHDGYQFDLEFQKDFLTFIEETSAAVKNIN